MPAPPQQAYEVNDEVSCATPHGMIYGTVKRIVSPGANGAVEIEYEDGRKEVRKAGDRAMSLLRRPGAAKRDQYREDIDEVRRSDIRRGRH